MALSPKSFLIQGRFSGQMLAKLWRVNKLQAHLKYYFKLCAAK